MDALQANDTKLVQQYAQLIATGMAALKIV